MNHRPHSAPDVQWGPSTNGALAGLRVLDLSRILAGPYLTMLLADLGADVIKIERDHGDDTRSWGPPYSHGEATYFWSANRNKRSVVFDLNDAAHREAALQLAAESDVVVENFRPGVAERLGLGYDDVNAVNPRVVYCSISAFGDAPQARDRAGYDLLVQAMGGLMSITGTEESGPVKVGVALVDVLAALHGCVGVLAALKERDASGTGQRVDVTMLQSLLASLVNQGTAYLGTGLSPGRIGNQHPSIAPYQTIRASDGDVALACGNDKHFAALCDLLGLSELATDPRFATNADRVGNRDELIAQLEAVTSQRHGADLVRDLCDVGVPTGQVNSIAEAFAAAEELGLAPVRNVGNGDRVIPQISNPLRMSRTPVRYDLPPPLLGSGVAHQDYP